MAIDVGITRARLLRRAECDLQVAVIGAGPHGLSAAVHLRRAGVQAHVFGRPMSFWRALPEEMTLRSNMSATNMIEPTGPLSLASYSMATGEQLEEPMPLNEFLAYGYWVQRMGVPDVDERTVTDVKRAACGFLLSLTDGTLVAARQVVIACGIAPFAWTPPGFDDLPADHVSHTADHRDFEKFRGKRVAVVGGGQSALGWASLLQGAGAAEVQVLARAPIIWLRDGAVKKKLGPLGPVVYAPTDVGPIWYSRLVATPALFRRFPRQAQGPIAHRCIRPACSHFVKLRLGDVRVRTGVRIVQTSMAGETLRIALSDGDTREVDHLMFGTGYKIDIARYAFLGEEILGEIRRVEGYPVLRRGLESTVPNLHITGAPAAWSFGPILRFVSGSWYAGRAVARAITGRAHAPARPTARQS